LSIKNPLHATAPEQPEPGASLIETIRARVALLGGIDLELPERGPIRAAPDLLA